MKTTLWLPCLLLLVAGPAAASPIRSKTESNVWVFAPGAASPTSWRVGVGRTNLASDAGGTVSVRNVNGTVTALTGVSSADYGVLVNQGATSWTPFHARMPAISFYGLDTALFTPADANTPKVTFSPRGGAYTAPLQVALRGVPTPQLAGPVRLFWRLDGGAEQAAEGDTARIRLVAGTHTLTARSEQAGVSSAARTETFTLALPTAGTDSDGDGIPDLVEAELGLDPFTADLDRDSDHDGWSDFDEWLREGDTTDADGDGWSDRDEGWRGTDPTTAESRPAAERLYQVEVISAVSAWQDAGGTLPQPGPGALEMLDLFWRPLVCRRPDGFEAPCAAPGEPDSVLIALDVPHEVRTAADAGRVIRWQAHVSDAPSALVLKTHDAGIPDLSVAWVRDRIAADGLPFTTAAQWRDQAVALIRASLVQSRTVDLSPVSGAALHLLEALVHWQAGLAEHTVAYGHALGAEPTETVERMATWYGGFYRGDAELPATGALDRLVEDLDTLLATGGPAAPVTAYLEDLYALFVPAAGLPATVDLAAADQLQHDPAELSAAVFAARLLFALGAPSLEALPPAELAQVLDPTQDFDGDGLTNADELAAFRPDGDDPAEPGALTAATATDADADGQPDTTDACPQDPTQGCLTQPSLVADSDGDGMPDALDNCLNTANADQRDDDLDGLGDACPGLAVITNPVAHLSIPTGRTLDFRSQTTPAGTGLALTYAWRFDGAAPDRAVADPGPVFFAEPGTFDVRLRVSDGASTSEDFRTITVTGPSRGLPGALIAAEPAVEGLPAALSLAAVEDNGFGPLAVTWDFGDGASAAGATTSHVYASDGTYTVTAVLTDTRGASRAVSRALTVADAGPAPAFTVASTGLDRELSLADASRSMDALVSWEWTFGDGTPAESGPSVRHTWLVPGDYEVNLTVMDTDGDVASVADTVHVTGSGLQLLVADVSDAWSRVDFSAAMEDPIVVPGPIGSNEAEPGALQVRAVDGTGFEVRLAEWSNLDGLHGAERVPFVAAERGHHRFPDGTELEADSVVASGTTARLFYYDRAFAATPRVFVGLQTAEDAAPAVARPSSSSRTAFWLALNEEEAGMGSSHRGEEVGYLALYRAGYTGDVVINGAAAPWRAVTAGIGDVPVLVGGCRLRLAEDTTLDPETLHKKETTAVLSLGGQCLANTFSRAEMDPFVIRRVDP